MSKLTSSFWLVPGVLVALSAACSSEGTEAEQSTDPSSSSSSNLPASTAESRSVSSTGNPSSTSSANNTSGSGRTSSNDAETSTNTTSRSSGSRSEATSTEASSSKTSTSAATSESEETGASSGSTETSTDESSSSNQELTAYVRLCATCHGPTGDGVEELGPDIKHPVEDYSEWVIRNGRTDTTMLAFDTEMLSDVELAEIMQFLGEPAQPTTGEGLYLDYCAACHGEDGTGGPTTRPVVGEAGMATQLVRNGHNGAFSNRREYMPKWSTDEISDAQLQLIITYIQGF